MTEKMEIISHCARGSFGDKRVLIQGYIISKSFPLVLLLHGVHGCANLAEGNKYGVLARLLAQESINVLTIETSRKTRDRDAYGNDRDRWIMDAFKGKTYAMDLFDVASAISFIHDDLRWPELWLWGFSLGGLHFLILTGGIYKKVLERAGLKNPITTFPKIEGLILSGSGDEIRPENGPSFHEPILDSLPCQEMLLEAAKNTNAENVYAFYGSLDETFAKEACRRLFELTPTKRDFIVLEGVDHSFRTVNGIPSISPLIDMVNYLKKHILKNPGPTR